MSDMLNFGGYQPQALSMGANIPQFSSNNALGAVATNSWQNSNAYNFGNGYSPMAGNQALNNQWADYQSTKTLDDAGGAQTGQLGMNIPTFQLGLSGLSAIGNLWGAYQSQKLAGDQFDFAKNMANKNLANQTASYNTALSDRATSRASMEGWSDAQTQDYISKNKLSN